MRADWRRRVRPPGWGRSGSCAGPSSSSVPVGPFTGSALAGVCGDHLQLTAWQQPVAGVRVETPPPLRHPYRQATHLHVQTVSRSSGAGPGRRSCRPRRSRDKVPSKITNALARATFVASARVGQRRQRIEGFAQTTTDRIGGDPDSAGQIGVDPRRCATVSRACCPTSMRRHRVRSRPSAETTSCDSAPHCSEGPRIAITIAVSDAVAVPALVDVAGGASSRTSTCRPRAGDHPPRRRGVREHHRIGGTGHRPRRSASTVEGIPLEITRYTPPARPFARPNWTRVE